MQGGVITYPIPLYQNLPIEAQYYQPSRFVISAVTLGITTLITTTINHNYVIGQEVRLLFPISFGCSLLNEVTGLVLSIPNPNQVLLNINSTGSDPYIASTATTQAQIVAIGDINSGATNFHGRCPTHTYIPGSFQDISPI